MTMSCGGLEGRRAASVADADEDALAANIAQFFDGFLDHGIKLYGRASVKLAWQVRVIVFARNRQASVTHA